MSILVSILFHFGRNICVNQSESWLAENLGFWLADAKNFYETETEMKWNADSTKILEARNSDTENSMDYIEIEPANNF